MYNNIPSIYMFGKLIILLLKVIFWGDFLILKPGLKLFLKLLCYHETTFNSSYSENITFCQ